MIRLKHFGTQLTSNSYQSNKPVRRSAGFFVALVRGYKIMTFSQKVDLIKAACLVADFWGVEPSNLVGFISLGKPENKEEWNKIAVEVQEFAKMDIVERGEKLGIKLKRVNN